MTAKWKTLFGALVLVWLLIWASVWQESQVVARLTPAVVGTVIQEEEASPCPSGSNYLSAWNGDYTGDTDKICYNAKASTKDGTQGGTVELTSDYGRTGVGLQITAANEYLAWVISSDDLINDELGTLCVDIYLDVDDITANTQIWEASDGTDTNDSLYCWVQTNDTVRCSHIGNAAQDTATSVGTVAVRTWTTVKYSWDLANDLHGVCLTADCDITAVDENDDLDAMTTVIDELALGEHVCNAGGTPHTTRIDNLRIYNTYNATCE